LQFFFFRHGYTLVGFLSFGKSVADLSSYKETEIRYTQGMMRKQYTAAFKARVVQELFKEEKTLAQIAAEYEVHATQLKNWRATALEGLPGLFEKQDSTGVLKAAHEQQLTELYAEIGKLTTQVAWLKKKLQI
jgi:transposase